ncbi:hypothetical protein SI65_02420 [Aspergillus cristatus]|uniref:Uncharacterized protein n=1 Tax=Aspergillus cristatus TaxID=573508 RepID=A0A1E3BMF6_ASPCR|nr:hypothetical protein SI65_02420 [Aspergillus cristatus]
MNDSSVASFLRYSGTDRRPDTPTLSLSLELLSSSATLNRNGKPGILITVHRSPNDTPSQPCIFYWSSSKDGFGPDGFLLLHHTTEGHLEQVEIEPTQHFETPNFPEIRAYDHSIHEFSPGGSDRRFQKIPERYRDVLIPGDRYELVWSGEGLVGGVEGRLRSVRGRCGIQDRRCL